MQLARYSSLTHLWRIIAGAERMGREVTLVRGDTEETARRKISGYALANAGTFIDTTPILRDLEDGFDVHPALVALLAGCSKDDAGASPEKQATTTTTAATT